MLHHELFSKVKGKKTGEIWTRRNLDSSVSADIKMFQLVALQWHLNILSLELVFLQGENVLTEPEVGK